ncbi:hypothetical protein HAZT_HAZT008892 [Hyalella azteca]|uniref:C2H2-type domain-containing protein n=1 Tax=Hyalella azteca TaxID=294128 RepID=A0A6A0GVB0_HYAAZ|nr:hypothetical protein HAZT_HAZT008892 [Hyalella azteca]
MTDEGTYCFLFLRPPGATPLGVCLRPTPPPLPSFPRVLPLDVGDLQVPLVGDKRSAGHPAGPPLGARNHDPKLAALARDQRSALPSEEHSFVAINEDHKSAGLVGGFRSRSDVSNHENPRDLVSPGKISDVHKGHVQVPGAALNSDRALSSGLASGCGGALRLPVSLSSDIAAAIPSLPVACLPSAFSSLATLGMSLCAATAATNGSVSPSFGKISPTYGSGATGSRGGTPDIPQASSMVGATTTPKTAITNGTLPKFSSSSVSPSQRTSDSKPALNGGSPPHATCPVNLSSLPPIAPNGSERQSYSCPLCGKQFGQPYNLRRHMSTHTGDRPFQCPHCEYAASQNVHLDKHIRRIHLNVNGSAVTSSNSNASQCVSSSKPNAINSGAGMTTSNGKIKVENCLQSPSAMGTHWKYEATAVTP